MATNWIAVDEMQGMSTKDQADYVWNKKKYDEETDSEKRASYNAANQLIRKKYGIKDDRYGFSDSQKAYDINTQSGNPYIRKADNVDFNVDTSSLREAKDNLQNFEYDAENDSAMESYSEQAARVAESASKSALNRLNQSSMGRNSSYSSAAVAQVEQAYRRKVADKSAELAEIAYNKLKDKYQLERENYELEYNKRVNEFNRYNEQGDRALNRYVNLGSYGMSEESHDMDRENHDRDIVYRDINNNIAQKGLDYYDTDKQYEYQNYDDSHNLNTENLRGLRIDNDYKPSLYDEQISASQKSRELTDAQINQINSEVDYNNYTDSVTTLDKLNDFGFVNGDGNCAVVNDGNITYMSAEKVAELIDSGIIKLNSNDELVMDATDNSATK